jgi:hypothetical protein
MQVSRYVESKKSYRIQDIKGIFLFGFFSSANIFAKRINQN